MRAAHTDRVAPRLLSVTFLLGSAIGACGGEQNRAPPAAAPSAATTPSAPPRAPGPISTAALDGHLRALQRVADANGGNRAAGTPGDRASVAYVIEQLRGAGLKVRTQRVRFPFFRERRAPRVLAGERALKVDADVRTLQYSGSGKAEGPVRAIGFEPGRASDAGCSRGDFAAVQRGEVVVVQRGTCTLRRKADHAARAGASAILIANDGRPRRTGTISGSLGSPGVRVPALSVSTLAGGELSRAGRVNVDVSTISERRTTRNVLAETAGAGAGGGQVVMVGGHLDSVDEGPGINDNASGVATLLELAARSPRGQALRFAFWGAEENWLLGSRHYVDRLADGERRRISAYLNLDMIGSSNATLAFYADDDRVARALRAGLRSTGRAFNRTDVGHSSDHAPFARKGIAVGGLFTGADATKSAAEARRFGGRSGRKKDLCYHRACDTQANVSRGTITGSARAVEAALRRLAGAG